jgi:hypothetical protein
VTVVLISEAIVCVADRIIFVMLGYMLPVSACDHLVAIRALKAATAASEV